MKSDARKSHALHVTGITLTPEIDSPPPKHSPNADQLTPPKTPPEQVVSVELAVRRTRLSTRSDQLVAHGLDRRGFEGDTLEEEHG